MQKVTSLLVFRLSRASSQFKFEFLMQEVESDIKLVKTEMFDFKQLCVNECGVINTSPELLLRLHRSNCQNQAAILFVDLSRHV